MVVGAKSTLTVSCAPAASVSPAWGAPVTVNGAPGSVTEPNVSGCPPSFVRVKLCVASPPTGRPPKSSRFRLIERCAVASWPVPASGNCTVPRLVAPFSEPARDPAALGLNRTGTESVPPGSSVVGSAGDGVPTRNSALVLVTLLTVTERRSSDLHGLRGARRADGLRAERRARRSTAAR